MPARGPPGVRRGLKRCESTRRTTGISTRRPAQAPGEATESAGREFYQLFGFEDAYEGAEFPGFLAVRSGEAIIGLQAASAAQPAYVSGLRWQFELSTTAELDAIVATCRRHSLAHRIVVEEGGSHFQTCLVVAESPSGVEVWFEGPNEAQTR